VSTFLEPADPSRLLTPTEVAACLQVPVSTLYQWRYVGKGPRAIRVGRHLRWRPSELDQWLTEQDDRETV